MKRKVLSLLLALTLCVGMAIPAFAASSEAVKAADKLHELGLFNGVGNNADGTPNYDLDRAPTRAEAVTLLVRLLGKEAEAKAGNWTTPFTDVADWAKPYVGYAYKNGLTSGTSATTFGGSATVSATQYLTFVLRAMGYTSDTDFQWDKAWELTDKLGITSGQYNASSAFTRGDAVIVSAAALDKKLKDGSKTLLEAIKENLANAPEPSGRIISGTMKADNLEEPYFNAEVKYKMEIISAYEAVFTLEFDFPVSREIADMYGFFLLLPNDTAEFYYSPSVDRYISRYAEADLKATFTETRAEDGLVTFCVTLPTDSVVNFNMITDDSNVRGFIMANYG